MTDLRIWLSVIRRVIDGWMHPERIVNEQERRKAMSPNEIQRTREILRRMTSLRSSAESLKIFLSNLQPTSELSPELRSLVAATSAFLSLTTAAVYALQYDAEASQSTGDSTMLESWSQHWRTALENFESHSHQAMQNDLFDE
jgi:hypothetical protein